MPRWQTTHRLVQQLSRLVGSLLATAVALVSCTPASMTEAHTKADTTQKTSHHQSPNRHQRVQKTSLTISAAASLQNALTAIEPLFQQAHPDIEIVYNWGGSGTLQRQIEQGAPADIFFPASQVQMQAIARKNLLHRPLGKASSQAILGNQLVLIAPKNSPLTNFEHLSQASAEQLAVGEFRSVPAGQYAKATLTALKLLPQLTPELIFFSNVRGVLAAVESGHVEAGLVYKTDAELSDRVKIVAIAPPKSHPPIQYPIAILQRSPSPEAAQTYIDFLSTPPAQTVFQQFGFITGVEPPEVDPRHREKHP